MSETVAGLLAELEVAARAAWKEEEAMRTKLAQEIARLERRRASAYRRMNFVRVLAAAVKPDATDEAAASAVRAEAKRDLGWSFESDFHREVLDRLQPVGAAIAECICGPEGNVSDIQSSLETFETWYETKFGESFYAQFDREPPEVNLVET